MDRRHPGNEEDDGRIIADMSDVERQPFLIPRPDLMKRGRDSGHEEAESGTSYLRQPVVPDRAERRAMISGALSAGLLAAGILAASFAAVILLILALWG